MSLRDIEAFLAVVETGSIIGAAAQLHLTQPGLTRRVQSLEQLLGAELLDRNSKPLRPTRAGRQAYEQGRRVLRAFEDMRCSVGPEGEIGGEFRIGISPYLSDAMLTRPMDRMRGEFDRLSLRVSSGWSSQLLEKITQGSLDVAAICLAEGMVPPADMAAEPLGNHRLMIVAPASSPLPDAPSVVEIAAQPWVLNQDGCGLRGSMRRQFEAVGLPLQVAIEAGDPNLRLSLIAHGHGIGLATARMLKENPFGRELRVLDVPSLRPAICLWMVHKPPLGRLEEPLALLGEEFKAALALDEPPPL
jgi:DNA-binding transcriptional LysR family regulator